MTTTRRTILKVLGAAPAASAAGAMAAAAARVALVVHEGAQSPPVEWAVGQLKKALAAQGAELVLPREGFSADVEIAIIVARPDTQLAKNFPAPAADWAAPDALRLVPGDGTLLVSANDPRGFVYALTELASRVAHGGVAALHLGAAIEESSPNAVRSIARAFLSEIEDMSWFLDKDGWRDYLDMLAAARFNRFNFALGFGYDFPRGVTGDYLHFPYPYLVEVPGHDVTITPPLKPGEQARNLEMLKFIARETGARGLDFQLGIWTHAWAWTESPHSDHVIGGLDGWPAGARYSRDALAILLRECPEITGITLRVHGESGVPEGTYDFWQTLFEAIAGAGRRIEIEMHAKGINQIMIDMAVKTGQPVKVGPKFSAEHQSLGYHQADIRELEIPTPERMETGTFAVSNGARRFTRYGYADLYQQDRKFDILYRLWPGTQRHLLSGDPAWASAMGRAAHFCGAAGLEICEPLTFKGREGSGHPGGRNAYAGDDTAPDWRKFRSSYALWGRLLYNPEASADAWRRDLVKDYGDKVHAAEVALSNASRVLPLLTSAHLPSASNHSLWYEVYTNQPLLPPAGKPPYSDSPKPYTFGAASPLDPQLFSTIDQHAADLLAGRANAKYSPIEVAAWLDGIDHAASPALVQLTGGAALTRLGDDVAIQLGIARFFAAKLKAGVLFALWQQSGDAQAGRDALTQYQKARAAWAAFADPAAKIYQADIAYGDIPMRHGDWQDRLAAMDADIAAVRAAVAAKSGGADHAGIARAAMAPKARPNVEWSHAAPERFVAGAALPLRLDVKGAPGEAKSMAKLFYRHVNHAERWQSLAMTADGNGLMAAIPADYTASPYPLQYYFVLEQAGQAVMLPGLNRTLSNQPYFAIWRR